MLYPTMSEVLAFQLSVTVSELSRPPLPASAIASAPALLVTAIDPAMLSVADGANITFNTAVCPGVNVVFAPVPFALNPAPVTSTLARVMLTFPVFVSVTPRAPLLPTGTLPKSRLVVLELSDGADAMPMPLVAIANGELGASLTTEIEPVAFPADVGANTTLKAAFWPAAMLIGSVRPDVLNPAPVTFALEIITLVFPPFCSVMVCEFLEPAATSENRALIGAAESCGFGVLGLGALEPFTLAQPLAIIDAVSTKVTRHFDVVFTSDL